MLDGRRPVIRWAGVGALIATLIALGALAGEVLSTGPVQFTTGNWPLGVGITLRADALGVTFALLSAVMLTAAVLHHAFDEASEREFAGLALLLAAGLDGTFLTGDVFSFYVFFELSLAAAYVLVVYGRSRRVLGAGLVFTAVNLLGTFVFLLSVASVYRVTGTLDMVRISERMAVADPNAAMLIAVGFFVAFSVKLGLFPFHFWLPTVYTSARPAVAAILSGSLANIGAYGLLRFGGEMLPRELQLASRGPDRDRGGVDPVRRRARRVAPDRHGDACLFGHRAGRLRPRRRSAIGGPVGFAAAILYTIVNATNKTMLFLTTRMRGVVVGGLFALGALSIAGIPPAAGFIGKLEVFQAVVGQPVLVAVALLGSLLSIVYAFQIYQFEQWRPNGSEAATSSSWRHHVVPLTLGVAILSIGLWPEPLVALSDAAAAVLARS